MVIRPAIVKTILRSAKVILDARSISIGFNVITYPMVRFTIHARISNVGILVSVVVLLTVMASLGMTTVSMLSKVRVILVLVVQVRHQLRKQNVGPVDFTGTIQPIRAISTSRPVLISVMTGRLAQMQIGVFTHSPDVPLNLRTMGPVVMHLLLF